MAHDARAIANEFIKRAKRDGLALTNMQLQKLPYIAHGWSWALLGHSLINESPTAWPYGPVYESLYRTLRYYGGGAVTDYIHYGDEAISSRGEGGVIFENLNPEEQGLIEAVWNVYRKFTAYQLSDLTHQEGTPWSSTPQGGLISDELIRDHYRKLKEERTTQHST